MSDLRRQAAEGKLYKGATARITRTFTRQDVETFGNITRDYNPVHYEPRWCELKGFEGRICHGLLVGSMLCEPGGQWGCLASGISFRFLKPVYIGDTITCEMTITDIDERLFARASCVFTNQHGEIVGDAELSGFLPDEASREQLQTMQAEGDPTNPLRRPGN